MSPTLLFLLSLVILLFTKSLSLDADPEPIKNITVMGTVFCDACSNNTFSKHSYFLQGATVQIECKLRSNSTSNEEISITVDRTTDRFGVYKLEIPPVDGFECREGHEPDSFCRATLVASSSPMCDVPGLKSSTEHVALKNREANACAYNLNALSYRPAKKDATLCGTKKELVGSSMNSSLFFWPPFPPFGLPWLRRPSFPFPFPPLPFPRPPSLPFPFPPIPFFTPPPSFPFPLPPWWPTPNPPPSFPFTFPPPPPVPSLFPPPSPPPPSFPFPPLPPFPPFTPIPSLFTPPPPPPPPPTFRFPFPPFPPFLPAPGLPSPPPAFSLTDPRTWFPFLPPSPPNQPQNQNP